MFLTFLNFPGLFIFSDFWTYPVTKSKRMLLPIRPYINVCQKGKTGFVMFKKIQINCTISASEIVVLRRARSVFYAAKFKKVNNTGDLTYS